MKKMIFILILSSIMIGRMFCQEKDILIGRIVEISNPCLDEPCLSGTVFAVKNDTSNFIISLNETWQWVDNPLIIKGDTLSVNDSIKVIGIISAKTDLQNEIYYEIEVDTTFFLSTSINQIIVNDILTYPNPSNGTFLIQSNNSNINGVEVLNLNGKSISFSKSRFPVSEMLIKNLHADGLVILKIETDNNKIITKKILIQ